ncbi:MAG: murein biosynthesis integral membrane protein MurJ [Micavibrio sp.]|nr:MAG: murein biosynthesis integral membrane protein MurJ [Micavibrio sp.]
MKFFKAMATIGSWTMLSRLAGFLRDMLTAIIMGAGPLTDAFFVALKLPNFFRRITAEGAFSAAFVPVFSGKLAADGRQEAMGFARNAQAMMLTILLPFAALIVVAMPLVVPLIAPGFVTEDNGRYDLAVELARITFPYMVLISLVALLGGVMNAFDRFAPFAAMPLFFNLALIAALLYAAAGGETASPAHAMAWGVLAAGVMQLLWMMFQSLRAGAFVGLARPRMTPEMKKTFALMGPGILGAGIAQINLFIDMILASFLPAGAISYLYYADRLYQFPLSIIGISIGVALLPMLARAIKSENHGEGQRLFSQALSAGALLALPAAAGLAMLAAPIISALFEYGKFTAEDTLMSARALQAYALALPAFIAVKIFSAASFAAEDTKTPVRYAIIGSLVNIVFSILLLIPLGHVGIALATAIGAWVNALLLARKIVQQNPAAIWTKSETRQMLSLLMCTAAMTAVLAAALHLDAAALFPATAFGKITHMFALVFAGMAVYFSAAFFTGNMRYLKELFRKSA